MSLDLVGITIKNKYYRRHYLSAIFEGDLKDTFSQWQVMDDNYREAVTADQQKSSLCRTSRPVNKTAFVIASVKPRIVSDLEKFCDTTRNGKL